LSGTASQRIASSIAEFQRGESSEARTYLAKSERFSSRTGDAAFHATSILFVQEENGHASLLLRFMQLTGIPASTKSFGDRVFRLLRALGDIGWASRVLIIAELIAQEYYPCLQAATDHPVLKRICDKIVFDEESHITFQIERIVRVEASLGFWQTILRDRLQTGLMAGAALMVYRNHHRVLASRVGFAAFLSRALLRNRNAILSMQLLRLGTERKAVGYKPLTSDWKSG